MEPYYGQSAQSAGQQQARGPLVDPSQAHLVGPSAPPMQAQQQMSMGQQQAQGGHRSANFAQQQSAQQQQAYALDYQTGAMQQSANALNQQQQAQHQQRSSGALIANGQSQVGLHAHSGSGHHHGGQPPLPPHQASGGHGGHSSRYGERSHRSAMLHQHRSSAAAISDPMMASTITDQLASAAGPLTGSGSALNQLGVSGGPLGAGNPYGASSQPSQYYSREPQLFEPGVGYPAAQHHQSRYESHYLPGGGRSRHAPYQASATTAGAYHLDRTLMEPSMVDPTLGGALSREQRQQQYHQSLGNLNSATSRLEQRHALENQAAFQQKQQQERYFGPERSGSMPPLGVSGGLPEVGLGSYNPLEDPLATHQLHSRTLADPLGLGLGAGHFAGPNYGPNPHAGLNQGSSREVYLAELRARLQEVQNNYVAVKRELDTTTQKLGSSMHSIKSFWSPELKKERALRKEEATKFALVNDQMKLMRVENQKQALLIRQLEDELRLAHETRFRNADADIQQHIDALCMEKENLFKDNCVLRETIRELEMRIETQKQTLAARDDSIKKMVEMMNNKGIATKIMEDERMEMDRIKTRNIELEARLRHYETIIEAKEKEIIKPNPSFSSAFLDPNKPKSPSPKQRKSLAPSTTRSKAERLKSRLNSTKSPANKSNGELTTECSASSNWTCSPSSSSGVGSSKTSSERLEEAEELRSSEKGDSKDWTAQQADSRLIAPATLSGLRLCECVDCQASGQPIYQPQRQPTNNLNQLARRQMAPRPPTPPRRKMEELRSDVAKRDQEQLTSSAKMKALEDQLRDSQRHIRVLKDSLVAKDEHYSLLLADAEELRRNLDERNKQMKSFQMGGARGEARQVGQFGAKLNQFGAGYAELQELQGVLELREKKIAELQRKLNQLEALLGERDAHLDRARMRLEHSSGHQELSLVGHLEETLADKEKQICLLRDQRDRAEHELGEERDSHERTIKEYKMKLNSLKFEMDKLQSRQAKEASKYGDFTDRFQAGAQSDQATLVKRLELDKRSLQLECERLKDKLEAGFGSAGRRAVGSERASSALGEYSVAEFERLQEALEAQRQELRRAQAEGRMSELERKRAQEEADKLSERLERVQSEVHKLKAKLENAQGEREQLLEECERQQQLIGKAQGERDSALADINQLKLEAETQRQQLNKSQLQVEKLSAQLERGQLECKRLEERLAETGDELRRYQAERLSGQRELKRLELEMQSGELQRERAQQEREHARQELEALREKLERLEAESARLAHEKELGQQQAALYKERLEAQQAQVCKFAKEREQMALDVHELRERLHKQQKLQDSSEHETRNEVRVWREKYERLMGQFERLNQEAAGKAKEAQLLVEKLGRLQSEAAKLEARLEQSDVERERLAIELEKAQASGAKARDEQQKWRDELEKLQEAYTKTNSKLLKLAEAEEKLRMEQEKSQMDLEVVRDRYEKQQLEMRKLAQERDRMQLEQERLRFERERGQESSGAQSGAQSDELARLTGELERASAKLEQFQREMNKLQLEKERVLLDAKAQLQAHEQQFQQQLIKARGAEKTAAARAEQAAEEQAKLGADKERLQQQLLLLQQEVEKFRNQQSSSAQETKKLHDEELARVLQELETVREKYTQQRKELLQLRELQQNHELDKELLRRELQSAEQRLERLNQGEAKQKQDAERCLIEIEKLRDKSERKQQELARAQKERNQFAQEITLLHQQIQQLQLQLEQQQQQKQPQQQQPQQPQQPQQQQQALKPEELAKLRQALQKTEAELQKTLAENQRLQMEVERLKLQLDDAAEYIGKVEAEGKLVQKQQQELVQQLKQQQANAGQAQEIARQRDEMRKMQDVIKKSALEMQKMLEERAKLDEAKLELQAQLKRTKADFQATVEQLEAEIQRQRSQQQQQQQQQQASAAPQAANDEYKVKFEKAVEAIRAFQKTSDDMKKEIIKLNERNKSLSEQNAGLAQSLKAAAEEGAEGQQAAQLAQLSEHCASLEHELDKLAEETRQQQLANQQLSGALEKARSEAGNLKNERDRFQAQLEKLVVELERRQEETAKLQAQQDKSSQSVQSKQEELAGYQKQLEEREKALELKREELQQAAARQQQQQQQQQPAAAGQNQTQQAELVAKLQQQVKALEEERAKLRGELERVRNELKQSQAELERLLKILSASEEEKFNLGQQIEQLQAKLRQPQQAGGQAQQQARAPQQAGEQQAQQQQQRAQANQQAQRPQAAQQQQSAAQQGQQQARQSPQQQQQQQQQQQARNQQAQQQAANQNQRPSGAGGFISGFFQ